MWSTFIMDLLLLLQAFGTNPPPGSQAYELDFNNNGTIDMADFIHMLSLQPPLPEDDGLYYRYENSGR